MFTHRHNPTQSILFMLALQLHMKAELEAPDFDGNTEAAQERVTNAALAFLDDRQAYIYQILSAYGLPVEKPNSYYEALFDTMIGR